MKILLDESGIKRALTRISYEIIEKNKSVKDVVLVGIKNRGDILAERIKNKIFEIEMFHWKLLILLIIVMILIGKILI